MSILVKLENLELAGITLIRDYVQLLFDGPILNIYTLPHVKIQNRIVTSKDLGYYDTLRSLINNKVISAYEDAEKIVIEFENDTRIVVSLKHEDTDSVEAALIRFEDGESVVWQVR